MATVLVALKWKWSNGRDIDLPWGWTLHVLVTLERVLGGKILLQLRVVVVRLCGGIFGNFSQLHKRYCLN